MFFYVIFGYIFSGIIEKFKITITHVYFSALTLAVSLGSSSNNFLEPMQMLMHERTCMIPIIDDKCLRFPLT